MILTKRLRICGKLALKSWMPGRGLILKRAAWIWLSESGTTSLDSSPSGRRLDGVSALDHPAQSGTDDLREQPDVAVVIPAWNERENIELLLPALKEMIADLGLKAEIIVADGGSLGGTGAAAERRGVPGGVRKGAGFSGAPLGGFAGTPAPDNVTPAAALFHRPVFLGEVLWARAEGGQ